MKRFYSSAAWWVRRHVRDPYVRASSEQCYRSRSAFKLLQIDNKFTLIKPGMSILELGSAPGGWTQVCGERLGSFDDVELDGLVVAVDREFMEPVDGVKFITGDFTHPSTILKIKQQLREYCNNCNDDDVKLKSKDAKYFGMKGEVMKFDLILSDMLPNLSGQRMADNEQSMQLCQRVLQFSLDHLSAPDGKLLLKILQSGLEVKLMREMEKSFTTVKIVKPSASRKDSREVYILAMNYRPS